MVRFGKMICSKEKCMMPGWRQRNLHFAVKITRQANDYGHTTGMSRPENGDQMVRAERKRGLQKVLQSGGGGEGDSDASKGALERFFGD